MANRKHTFAPGEFYHCYNRGVEKRNIFGDKEDYRYFIKSIAGYNSSEVLGKLRLHKNKPSSDEPITMLSYCLLPNHYHLLIRCNEDRAISKFVQRLSGGYTMYFNKKYSRSGALFQGSFKSKHIQTDQDLRQVLAYVHLNYYVHDINDSDTYVSWLNLNNHFVRGLTSNYGIKEQMNAVHIIKQLREGFD